MSYAVQLTGHYADVRSRLGFGVQKALAPSKSAEVALPPPVIAYIGPMRAPLDMLRPCSVKFLVEYAALAGGVRVRQIQEKGRRVEVIAARHHAMALVYQHTQRSLPSVGEYFGRDHTTVLSALKKLNARRKLVDVQEWVEAKQRAKTSAMERQNG